MTGGTPQLLEKKKSTFNDMVVRVLWQMELVEGEDVGVLNGLRLERVACEFIATKPKNRDDKECPKSVLESFRPEGHGCAFEDRAVPIVPIGVCLARQTGDNSFSLFATSCWTGNWPEAN
jgi:hypothetical protein